MGREQGVAEGERQPAGKASRGPMAREANVPCWCPPRSYVVNLTFPMASSSDAVHNHATTQVSDSPLFSPDWSTGQVAVEQSEKKERKLTRVESGLKGRKAVVLQHVEECLQSGQ